MTEPVTSAPNIAALLTRAALELRLHTEEYHHRTDPSFIEKLERVGREADATRPEPPPQVLPGASPMTRCSYIPPEGQSVIAIAKERGGTTDGDIAALVDRFGCKAEAKYEMTAEDDSDREQFACVDHVGHLCGDGYWLVEPVYVPSNEPITITNTVGIARAGFGPPASLPMDPQHGYQPEFNQWPSVLHDPGADRLALNLAASEAWRERGCPPGEIAPEPDRAQ